MSGNELHFISAMAIFFSAIIPLYFAAHLKKRLRILTFVLAGFVVIHGAYHMFGFLEQEFLSETVFEPMSIIALICFGLLFLSTKRRQQVVKV